MKITELHIENIKRIKAIQISPREGEPVVLTGDNAQGKSSVLDAIFFALLNRGLSDPVRHGSSTGTVRLTLSDGADVEWHVERQVRNGKAPKLVVSDPRGMRMPSPQGFLSALVGSGLARDPLEFARLNAPAQAAALREALGIDYSKLDRERQEAYDARREANALVRGIKARLDALPTPTKDASDKEISASDLFAKQQEAHRSIQRAAKLNDLAIAARDGVVAIDREIEALEVRLAKARENRTVAIAAADKARKEAEEADANAPSPEALAALDEQIEQVDRRNAEARDVARYRALEADLDEAEKRAAEHQDQIDLVDTEKERILREAKMPVEGMEVDDDGIRVGGSPFSQLSTAEQIRISAEVAMAQDPAIKVLIVREGALVNRANLKAIADQAAARGFQLWVERMKEEPEETGIHIVDGGIAYLDGEPVEAAAQEA